MPRVEWITPPTHTDQTCIVCGNSQDNSIILTAAHWHTEYDRVEVAQCSHCQSAFTLNASDMIAPYPSPDKVLEDPNFIYLIYDYLELTSGLVWKIPLLERLPFHRFSSVLEVGCNVGVTLDYCHTIWGVDVVGVEPSAYGVKGAELLNIPIVNAYTHEAEELHDRHFSLIYATEVLEHVPDPLAFLKEMRTYLEPDGILLITTPCSSALQTDIEPGTLYAALSPGAHYYLPSKEQLQQLALQAGYKHATILLPHPASLIAYLSDRPIRFQTDPKADSRLATYYRAKTGKQTKNDNRVRLGHMINYYISATKSKTPFDEKSLAEEIEKALNSQFNCSLDKPLELAERIADTETIFDIGKTIPYSLPAYLYHRADHLRMEGVKTGHCYELAALIAAKGLQTDYQNLFIYDHILRRTKKHIHNRPATPGEARQTTLRLRQMIDSIVATVPELNVKPLSLGLRIKRKLAAMLNRMLLNFK
ncbi:MAG: class I SAM-dependent methyltransferase [Candidatus Thiodiazotropha sp.]